MSCTICGKATGPGALLCRPCRAALKRARQFSVLEIPGTPPAVTMTGLLTQARPPVKPAAVRRPRRIGSKSIAAAVVAVAVATTCAFYAGQRLARADTAPGDAPALRAIPPLPAPRAAVEADNPERVSDLAPPVTPTRPRVATSKSAPKPVEAPLRSDGAVQEAMASQPSAPPAESVRAPAPAAAPAPPPDRWQTMGDALARCASEGGLSGFLCDQKVRLESCDGYWGRVPQCPHASDYPR
ncbi:MAG TPA: hypothetical protein VMN56_17740 [Casimicrobiaceae bacterium]|nr:hypothetical protein [Casimicrobiaceae bacterium]